MNDFEKVEKLREKADVTYEEAKKALEEANGDILDAMIILENQGKTKKPNNSSYSTSFENVKDYPSVVDVVADDKDDKKHKANEFGRKLKALIDKMFVNYIVVEKSNEQIIKMPLWMFALILLIGIHFIPVIIVISLFFGVRYSFVGEDDLKKANDAVKKAEDFADEVSDKVKDEYNKL